MNVIEPDKSLWSESPGIEWPRYSGNIATRSWNHKIISKLLVLRSISKLANGEEWIHVSISRPDRLPEYQELAKVKKDFLGDELEAYQVFPKKSDHVNVHSFCLHLWAPVDQTRRVANLQDLIHEAAI